MKMNDEMNVTGATLTEVITRILSTDGDSPGARRILFINIKISGARVMPAISVHIIFLRSLVSDRPPVMAPVAAMISQSQRKKPAEASVPPPRMTASRMRINCTDELANPVSISSFATALSVSCRFEAELPAFSGPLFLFLEK